MKFPDPGEATIWTSDDRGDFLVVAIPHEHALTVARGIVGQDFTRADLADAVIDAARMLALPGRISRALP